AGTAVVGTRGAEGQDPAGDPTPGQPELNAGLQDRNLILAVQSTPVHDEHATLPPVPGLEQEPLERAFRLVASEPVEVDVALDGDLPCTELPEQLWIQRWQMALDDLVRVREVERGIPGDQLGELRQHLRVLVRPWRERGLLLRLDPAGALRERAHLPHRGEELRGLVVLGRGVAPWRRVRLRGSRGLGSLRELQPLERIVERLLLLQMSRF